MAATTTPSNAPWSHEINRNNHGALVTIATSLMLVGSLMLLFTRLAVRWPWHRLLGIDDAAAIVGSVFACGQSAATFIAVQRGLGRHDDDLSAEGLMGVEKAIYAGDILYVFTLVGSQLAVSLLFLRLASSKAQTMTAQTVTGGIAVWGVASIFAVAIRPHDTWDLTSGNASEVANMWTGVGALSILIEVVLLLFPVSLVWNLQMARKSKCIVIFGFAFRAPKAVFTVLRILSIRHVLDHPTDIAWTYTSPEIWTQVEMHYSLIAATIPGMQIFLKNFSTGYLGTTADQVDRSVGTKGNSYGLSSVSNRMGSQGKNALNLRPGEGVTTTQAVHHDASEETESVTSDGSDRIIIRKTVQVDWEGEGSAK